MFRKTVHPLDLAARGAAAATPGGAILYWLAINGRLPFDFLFGLAYLLTAVAVMLCRHRRNGVVSRSGSSARRR